DYALEHARWRNDIAGASVGVLICRQDITHFSEHGFKHQRTGLHRSGPILRGDIMADYAPACTAEFNAHRDTDCHIEPRYSDPCGGDSQFLGVWDTAAHPILGTDAWRRRPQLHAAISWVGYIPWYRHR